MALLSWQTGKLIDTAEHGPATRSFRFEVTGVNDFTFKPGQFITLDLPIHEKPNKRLRSYSIVSWPDGTNQFELLVVQTPGGAGTQFLFHDLQPGGEIKFRGAQGVFTIPEDLSGTIFLICTGTGVAPFRSMIQYIYTQGLQPENLHLIYGCRTRDELLYFDEFNQMALEIPGFHYHPVLSRENWDGLQGRVHAVYESLCADKPESRFYLCGWKHMVDEARQRLRDLGFPDKSVHLELYG